jgi:muconolactone D-isomerase
VIAIVDLPDAESLDHTIMGGLPMAQYLEFEAIWPLREYSPFIEDCKDAFKAENPT